MLYLSLFLLGKLVTPLILLELMLLDPDQLDLKRQLFVLLVIHQVKLIKLKNIMEQVGQQELLYQLQELVQQQQVYKRQHYFLPEVYLLQQQELIHL